MPDRIDRFTEKARATLTAAQEEAQRFRHNYIGTEHLLLGLLRQQDGVAAKVLGGLGIELDKVRDAVEFIIGRGERVRLERNRPHAKSAKKVDEARRRRGAAFESQLHRVRSTCSWSSSRRRRDAFGVLESLGLTLERLRTEVPRILSQPLSSEPPLRLDPGLRATAVGLCGVARTMLLSRAGRTWSGPQSASTPFLHSTAFEACLRAPGRHASVRRCHREVRPDHSSPRDRPCAESRPIIRRRR